MAAKTSKTIDSLKPSEHSEESNRVHVKSTGQLFQPLSGLNNLANKTSEEEKMVEAMENTLALRAKSDPKSVLEQFQKEMKKGNEELASRTCELGRKSGVYTSLDMKYSSFLLLDSTIEDLFNDFSPGINC
ncbi:hypothetical protein L596_018223 [Steinernema carpocapsae]|uniref:Uncharacterized protein n=2 Tax=Steinernema carpocapsae TaxID=34508 RepID=A0A4U5N420_STECR|nr:hypothetical protein L596_018223 [Steinernema carpocapsae]